MRKLLEANILRVLQQGIACAVKSDYPLVEHGRRPTTSIRLDDPLCVVLVVRLADLENKQWQGNQHSPCIHAFLSSSKIHRELCVNLLTQSHLSGKKALINKHLTVSSVTAEPFLLDQFVSDVAGEQP